MESFIRIPVVYLRLNIFYELTHTFQVHPSQVDLKKGEKEEMNDEDIAEMYVNNPWAYRTATPSGEFSRNHIYRAGL